MYYLANTVVVLSKAHILCASLRCIQCHVLMILIQVYVPMSDELMQNSNLLSLRITVNYINYNIDHK